MLHSFDGPAAALLPGYRSSVLQIFKMANIQSVSNLKTHSGLVSVGHPYADLQLETATNRTVVTIRDLKNERQDRATRIQFCKTQHFRYHPDFTWRHLRPSQPPAQSTTFLELLATYWNPPHAWDRPATTTLDRVFVDISSSRPGPVRP